MSGTITQKTVAIDNLVTTTFYNIRTQIVDQVFKIRPFYDKMIEKGRLKEKVPDGTHWEVPVRYARDNANRKWFGRGAKFGRAETETLTRLLWYRKNVGTSIVRYFDDDQKNRGKAKLIDYAKEKVNAAKMDLMEMFEEDLLVQNADALSMNALPTLISTTPTTGSIGTKTRSTNSYLQNFASDFTGFTTGVSLQDVMTEYYNKTTEYAAEGSGASMTPDIILTTRPVYQDIERIGRAMRTIQTSTSSRMSLGFGDIAFKNTEIFWSPYCESGKLYLLNTGTLEFLYDPDVWFEMTAWKDEPDSLDRVAQVICTCNMTCNQFLKNAVIYNIATTTS